MVNHLILNEFIYYKTLFFHSESIPKFYGHFPATNKRKAIIITELLGEDIYNLHKRFNFSTVTVARIGLHVVS